MPQGFCIINFNDLEVICRISLWRTTRTGTEHYGRAIAIATSKTIGKTLLTYHRLKVRKCYATSFTNWLLKQSSYNFEGVNLVQLQSERDFASLYQRWRNIDWAQHTIDQADVVFSCQNGVEDSEGGSERYHSQNRSFCGLVVCSIAISFQNARIVIGKYCTK